MPSEASPTITLGVNYSLDSVVYLIAGGIHYYVRQFRLQRRWLKNNCVRAGVALPRLRDLRWYFGILPGNRSIQHVYVKTKLLNRSCR